MDITAGGIKTLARAHWEANKTYSMDLQTENNHYTYMQHVQSELTSVGGGLESPCSSK